MSLFPTTHLLPMDDVIGRQAFIRDVARRTAEHQSVMIPGPRRIGKTAVATEILRQCHTEYGAVTASVDLFLQSTAEEFAKDLIAAVLAGHDSRIRAVVRGSLAAISHWVQGSEVILPLASGVELRWLLRLDRLAPGDLVEHALALPQLLASRSGRPVVVLLDEFQDVMAIGGASLVKRMRALWQRQPDTAYIFIGSRGSLMRSLFGRTTQALYRFADVLALPDIPRDAWEAYIARKFHAAGVTIAPHAIGTVLDHTGGHPYDTMKVCQALYDVARDQGVSRIGGAVAQIGLARATGELAPLFESELRGLDALPHARKLLVRLARGQTAYPPDVNPSQVKRALDELMANGLIFRVRRGRYVFHERLFQQYLAGD